jgi:hypothetical protein
MEQHFKRALANITRHGDTDVFPFPIENHVFFDDRLAARELLRQLHKNFESALASYPPVNQSMLATVSYTGFRWATQLDPLWNAYFLALVLAIGNDIEAARIAKEREVVFSYRFRWDDTESTMFDQDYGWMRFQEKSLELARSHSHILVCDIADFYPRIYHHRLENSLRKATQNTEICRRIKILLARFSKGASYGLPVGGPAARLLSELLLTRVDKLLIANGATFCRFADDYHIFAQSAENANRLMVFLSEKLHENEGLLLQKSKTRVMSSEEFISTSEFAEQNRAESDEEASARQFLRLRLHFDPYSATAVDDYEQLQSELSRFDIVGLLAREMGKSRIHSALTRRLVSAVQHLDPKLLDPAVMSIVENIEVLYPVFSSVCLLLKSVLSRVTDETRRVVFAKIRSLIDQKSYIVVVPTNLAFAVRVLAYDPSEEADATLAAVYASSPNFVIRRDVILAMARRDAAFWISDVKNTFLTQTSWEKTALLIGSFILGDEGEHWRSAVEKQLSPLEDLVRRWAATRAPLSGWEIPL